MHRTMRLIVLGALAAPAIAANATLFDGSRAPGTSQAVSALPYTLLDQRPSDCPPCFDCTKPAFGCQQYGQCNEYDGACRCPPGFGGQDCSQPLCGSLADGRNRFPRQGDDCQCTEGWSGLTCNVCENDDACKPLVPEDGLRRSLGGSDDDDGPSSPAVCYKGGFAVKEIHQMCDVTNRKILDMLPGRSPQVTFSCDRPSRTCGFQFWIGRVESFYCGLTDCDTSARSTADGNSTSYSCGTVSCSCIPERMLCGEEGSIDISDFLTEEIKGPGQFNCRTDGTGCTFEEPAMNQLINDVFGDSHISLRCNAGECMHYSLVPGFTRPEAPDNSKLVAVSIAIAASVVIVACLLGWYLGRTQRSRGQLALPGDDEDSLTSKHVPASLHFANMSYTVAGRQVLVDASGSVRAGEVMAVIGASGAGKSSLLDLLGRRAKRGVSSGTVYVNGRPVTDESVYRRLVGFVDQEDTLMGTLTVYETILNSALLRLPRDMSYEAKRLRTLETMQELGLLGIRDSRIGEAGRRALSGGEKRRVSIACELVTSPSILYLDEPTSGLDAYNAHNVVETLVALARDYQRTVVMTIHQPRSDIVALFDRLVVLAQGRTVYSGAARNCAEYFAAHGHPCPPGYNLADFLIDLTMEDVQAAAAARRDAERATNGDAEMGNGAAKVDDSKPAESWVSRLTSSRPSSPVPTALGPSVRSLVDAFAASEEARELRDPTATARDDAELPAAAVRGYHRASWWTQLTILSGRSFKNLYRNPLLMLTHYAISILVAVICGFLFRDVTNDIAGFQNRLGLFFFILALFGFSCLTSLGVFANERILFMRERANGYYSPYTYFTAKVLFDTIPLRVVPPFILGAIIYKPVGLVPSVPQFWNLILVLVLFNLTASSAIFCLSIIVADGGVANLLGSLIMLYNLLFAGLLINREKVPAGVGWLQMTSFFHAAFEALIVNEVRYLQLIDHKYGVDIEVPSATILSLFGFRAQALAADVLTLAIMFVGFTALALISLVLLVKERR